MSLPNDDQHAGDIADGEVVEEAPGDDTIEPTNARHDVIEEAEVVTAATAATEAPLSFPRLHARTQRFTLGEPRNVEVAVTGERILFLRSRDGQDPVNCLWVVDAATGDERLLADPAELIVEHVAALPAAELARRERTREAAGGITSYAIDREGTLAAFAFAGRLFVSDVASGVTSELIVDTPVFDPRPDPDGARIAYVSGRTLCVAELDGSTRVLAGGDDEPDTVGWGSADFIAAEEMRRQRGLLVESRRFLDRGDPRRH